MITLKRTDGSIIAKCDTDNMAEAVVVIDAVIGTKRILDGIKRMNHKEATE